LAMELSVKAYQLFLHRNTLRKSKITGLTLSPDKLEAIKQKGYPISADPEVGHKGMKALDVIESVEAEVVVEVTPVNIQTAEPALSHITKAFKTGKHVVTTNKGPLALAMPALTELAEYNNVYLRFSGTVGGGTPMLEFAKRCLAGDHIKAIKGIFNGTTNYILTEMSQNQVTFQDALANAQKLGYAEREPSMDIDGFDTACKVVILSNWIMGKKVTLKDVDRTGIRDVTLQMLDEASKRGNTIKLIGSIDEGKPTVNRNSKKSSALRQRSPKRRNLLNGICRRTNTSGQGSRRY
jgi:homoserine dehydrogenase